MTPEQRVQRILDNTVGSDLTSWEKNEFMPNIRRQRSLSTRQEEVLAGIEERVLEDRDECPDCGGEVCAPGCPSRLSR